MNALQEERGALEVELQQLSSQMISHEIDLARLAEEISPGQKNQAPAYRTLSGTIGAVKTAMKTMELRLGSLTEAAADTAKAPEFYQRYAATIEAENAAKDEQVALTASRRNVLAMQAKLRGDVEAAAISALKAEQDAGRLIAKAAAAGDAKAEKVAQAAMDTALAGTSKANEAARSKQATIEALESESQELRDKIAAARDREITARREGLSLQRERLERLWDEAVETLTGIGGELVHVCRGLNTEDALFKRITDLKIPRLQWPTGAPRPVPVDRQDIYARSRGER